MDWRYKIFGLIKRVHSFGDLSTLQFKWNFSSFSNHGESVTLVNTFEAKRLPIFLRMNARSLWGWITQLGHSCRRLKLLTGHLEFKSAAFPWLPISKPDRVCGQGGFFRVSWLPSKQQEMYFFSNCIWRKEYDFYFSFLFLHTSSQIFKILNFLKSIRFQFTFI